MIIEIAERKYTVRRVASLREALPELREDKPKWITYDTETNGLHIIGMKPFAGAIAWKGKVFIFPTTLYGYKGLLAMSDEVDYVFAHNTTFDMHAYANGTGDPTKPLKVKRWGDTMGLCRLAFEAVSGRDGGDSLGLKDISRKYIDHKADRYEKAVKHWLNEKKAQDRKVLIALLKGANWTITAFNEFLKNNNLPSDILMIYNTWKEEYPEPTYKDVPEEIMLPYLAADVVLTDILVDKSLPVVIHRKQESVMEREFDLIPVVYKMERQGIDVDRNYLFESKARLEAYIEKLQQEMWKIAGQEFSVGQHKLIKEIYSRRLGYTPKSTDKQFMKQQAEKGDRLAAIIKKLRTLEKWLSTYVERIIEVTSVDGRFYTQLGQFNPVSGRFSGDAQQFPKDAVYTLEGDELIDKKENADHEVLFNPRKSFVGRTFYLDYSQVELRVQAHYTLPFGGDINLCRAYMPFRCIHYRTGESYDHASQEGRCRWNEVRDDAPEGLHWEKLLKQGHSVWIIPETGSTWIPTDVHSQTTEKALAIIGDMHGRDFAWWRNIGKRFNFMRNYGGGDQKASETLEIPLEHASAMNKGYTDAFPLVVTYQKKVEQAASRGYVENLYKRRYYLSDPRRFYKLANYLIQGSSADILKMKMLEIDKYINDNNLSLRMMLCVHDELQFYAPIPAEDHHFAVIKTIMEDTSEVMVPIVAEMEMTETTWADKKGVHVG